MLYDAADELAEVVLLLTCWVDEVKHQLIDPLENRALGGELKDLIAIADELQDAANHALARYEEDRRQAAS
jgi:hypothetical protein